MKKSYKPEQIVRLLQDVQAQLTTGASLREVAINKQLGVNPGDAEPLAASLRGSGDR